MSDDPEDDKEAAQSVRSIKPNKRSFFGFSRKERYVISVWLLPIHDFVLRRRTCFESSGHVFPFPVLCIIFVIFFDPLGLGS